MARTHGISGTYDHGCRCDACREAKRTRQRAYYRKVGGNAHRKPEHQSKNGRERWPETYRANDQIRRARKAGAEGAERIVPVEIYERDGWRCGICRKRVDGALTYPHPLSPSLDHIVPLSKDGDHIKTNVRLAHLQCNVRRGNRGTAEQLLLVG